MDTLIERKKRFTPRRIYGGAGVLFILVFVFYFIFRDTGSSMTIDKSRITIATVTENEFNDYVRVIGQVLPSRMIYLDAIEGGRVEERLHEEGAMVKKGDVILRLSNPLLNIGIMQSEADLAYQENELRNTRISMEQERLSLKQDRIGIQKEFIIKKRRYGQYKRLMEADDGGQERRGKLYPAHHPAGASRRRASGARYPAAVRGCGHRSDQGQYSFPTGVRHLIRHRFASHPRRHRCGNADRPR